MAPRKRTTRQHKVDPKTAKLEAFLQDFDCEGKFNLVLGLGVTWMDDKTTAGESSSKYRLLIYYSAKMLVRSNDRCTPELPPSLF